LKDVVSKEMAYFMVTFTYPPSKAQEVGQAFVSGKAPDLPDFVNRIQIFVVMDAELKTYSIYEVEDAKSHEGLVAITKRFTGYFDIEGSRFKIEPLLTINEALPLIGLG
jgi:hypothetical protein